MQNPKKITLYDVSTKVNISQALLRKMMREEKIHIGICCKHGEKYYYHIIEKDLRNTFGDSVVDSIVESIAER